MTEFFSNSTVQGVIGTALLALLTEGLRRIIKIEGLVNRVNEIERWKEDMEKELEIKFVRKDILELHLNNLKASNERIEKSITETHQLINVLVKDNKNARS